MMCHLVLSLYRWNCAHFELNNRVIVISINTGKYKFQVLQIKQYLVTIFVWIRRKELKLWKPFRNHVYCATNYFFVLVVRRVLEKSGNTFRTLVSFVKWPTVFFKYCWEYILLNSQAFKSHTFNLQWRPSVTKLRTQAKAEITLMTLLQHVYGYFFLFWKTPSRATENKIDPFKSAESKCLKKVNRTSSKKISGVSL